MDAAATPAIALPALEPIHILWDELAACAAGETEAALLHLLRSIAGMIDAQNAYWMGAARMDAGGENLDDPLLGWRPCRIQYAEPLPCAGNVAGQRFRAVAETAVDEYMVAIARQAGKFRANRFVDLVSPAWFKGAKHASYAALSIRDIIVVGVPISADAECHYGFLRMHRDAAFTVAERDRAAYALRGLTWFHRRVLLTHGLLLASSPLSPVERRVMGMLLTDRTEKSIAAELDVTPATVHTYVRGLLRKFGVSGRTGLVAVWLGQA